MGLVLVLFSGTQVTFRVLKVSIIGLRNTILDQKLTALARRLPSLENVLSWSGLHGVLSVVVGVSSVRLISNQKICINLIKASHYKLTVN